MPRYPLGSVSPGTIRQGVFSRVAHLLRDREGEVYPFHEGDTWLSPPEGCRMEDLSCDKHPELNRYAPTQGLGALIDAVVARTLSRTNTPTSPEEVLVTGGATAGLSLVLGALVEPGDEVLIPAPHWPLIDGIVRASRAVPVVLPFFDEGIGGGAWRSPEEALKRLDAMRSERTVALYVNSPNNPTGRVIRASVMEAMAAWARRHDLWILADEVYEDLDYTGLGVHCRPFAPERTFSVHSFSKGRGMAGYRIGYVIGPSGVMSALRKLATHTLYCAPRPSQVAGLIALGEAGERWLSDARARYQHIGAECAARLGLPPPEGGTFLFLDVAERLDARGLTGFLEDCAREGLLVAPGPSFGPYDTSVRVCFTAAPEELTARAMSVLSWLLGRGERSP